MIKDHASKLQGVGAPATIGSLPWVKKYSLTLLFALTALMVIAVAVYVVNYVIGKLAENNLARVVEDHAARDAAHLETLINGPRSVIGLEPTVTVAEYLDAKGPERRVPLTLELLTGPVGLPDRFPALIGGKNIVKFSLYNLNGKVLWSTDTESIGEIFHDSPMFDRALYSGVNSRFVRNKEVDVGGVQQRLDIVETYLPLRRLPTGAVVGVIGVYSRAPSDLAIQVGSARAAVLMTTVATMVGLFIVLLGFIVVANVIIYRSNRRELMAIAEANQSLEQKVSERTQEVEEANDQLVEAQDQLLRTEKLAVIGQLSASVAHDLRNPLGAINNAAYYLKRRLGASEVAQSNPKIGQFLQVIAEEVQRSNQIITDLMGFARISLPSLSPTNLEQTIQGMLSSIEVRDNVRIVKRFELELPEVLADLEQLRRVFINLTMNAQEAMPDGGELTISTRMVNGFAEVAFSDTGIGIPDENLKKVFDPLFTTKAKGTGLGLAVCQEIVTRHSGTIDVASKPGEGSTFTVRLPWQPLVEPGSDPRVVVAQESKPRI